MYILYVCMCVYVFCERIQWLSVSQGRANQNCCVGDLCRQSCVTALTAARRASKPVFAGPPKMSVTFRSMISKFE